MNQDSKKLSRREWFRLRSPHQNQMLSESTSVVENETLTPIEHPPNHDGLDLALLPPMREAVISDDQLKSLFTDIGQLATDVMLMQRTTGVRRASVASVDTVKNLEHAQAALLTGSIQRVQIRYRWKNSLWIDTLKREPNGFHLVRIAHQRS